MLFYYGTDWSLGIENKHGCLPRSQPFEKLCFAINNTCEDTAKHYMTANPLYDLLLKVMELMNYLY